MTMSKYINVCFIVLAALAIHAAPRTGKNVIFSNSTLRALKDTCIRGIQSTYIEVKRLLQEEVLLHPSVANEKAFYNVTWDGFVAYNRIVGRVHLAPSINTIERVEILSGVSIACEPEVTISVALLTQQMIASIIKTAIRV